MSVHTRLLALGICCLLAVGVCAKKTGEHMLSVNQQNLAVIAALSAQGDMPRLTEALNTGLDEGLSIAEIKEILVQMYAYTGFPRSLNALGNLMQLTQERAAQGKKDLPGKDPSPLPPAQEMLATGTANQTKLVGAPVSGPLFEFAPAIDQYLKSHLFGDIFARDNVSWQDRELATVAALAAMSGVEPQLKAHIAISMHNGITRPQLQMLAGVLGRRVDGRAKQQLLKNLPDLAAKSGKN